MPFKKKNIHAVIVFSEGYRFAADIKKTIMREVSWGDKSIPMKKD